jgi:DNA-binding HxlR family transcriptional regulator
VLEIVSLLDVSARSGLVSNMNFTILKQEFSNLLSHVDDMSTSHHAEQTHHVLHQSFFDVARGSSTPVSSHNTVSDTFPYKTNYTELKDIKNERLNSQKDVLKRNNRQNIIIGLLKKKKTLTIKDIAQTIRDCSEKTIQRELIALIGAGVLKKTGERRWSKYSLISEIQ